MTDPNESIGRRWEKYRPTKGVWFWSCAACIVLTMIVGFTAGGWVTGGTATEMSQTATESAREQLVATICVERFVNSANAATSLTALKDASTWEQDDYIQDGGWANIAALEEQVDGAADVCADRLMAMESLPARSGPATDAASTDS